MTNKEVHTKLQLWITNIIYVHFKNRYKLKNKCDFILINISYRI